MSIETASTSPLTIASGTFAGQAGFAFASDFLQRYQFALAATAEYVINQESSADANYADRALFSRMIASNPSYWAAELATLIAADPATIFDGCTDQDILNRVWTILPVVAYKASTIYYANANLVPTST